MKYFFTFLAACFVWTSCQAASPGAQAELCAEKQSVADSLKMHIKEIGDLATPPTEEDVSFLAKLFLKQSDFDQGQCQAYTQQVRSASMALIKKRASEIIPTLYQICSKQPEVGSKDLMTLAAMQEKRDGAIEALTILNESITECSQNESNAPAPFPL